MRAIPLNGTNKWTVEKDDGTIIRLMERDAVWPSENAAEAYMEYIQAPKENVKHESGIGRSKRLSMLARQQVMEQIAIKYGVTVSEMMARQ